jgi:hypothetical protein
MGDEGHEPEPVFGNGLARRNLQSRGRDPVQQAFRGGATSSDCGLCLQSRPGRDCLSDLAVKCVGVRMELFITYHAPWHSGYHGRDQGSPLEVTTDVASRVPDLMALALKEPVLTAKRRKSRFKLSSPRISRSPACRLSAYRSPCKFCSSESPCLAIRVLLDLVQRTPCVTPYRVIAGEF